MAARAKIVNAVKSTNSSHRYWSETVPAICATCLNPMDGDFFHGSVRSGWDDVCLCPRCNKVWGTGKNQRYTKQADGRYLRTN